MGAAFGVLAVAVTLAAWHNTWLFLHPPRRDNPSFTPSDFNLPFENVRLGTTDGLNLSAWFVPAVRPLGTVVFCHGYSGDKSPDLEYVPWLRDAGLNVLLFDFRAHGDSEGSFTTLGYFERRDLVSAMNWLHTRGIDNVVVMGFSMGGAVALLTAVECPAILGVISDSGFASLRDLILDQAKKRGMPRFLASLISNYVLFLSFIRTGANLSSIAPEFAISRISPRPVLIIHGGADTDVPVNHAQMLFDAARGPKELWIVPNAAHRRVDAAEPDEYRRRVLEFLDRLNPPGSTTTNSASSVRNHVYASE